MWSRRRFAAALPAGLAAPAFGQFRVEITGIGATQLPIALGLMRGETAAPVSISAIIRANLERSGAFKPVDAPNALDERSVLPPEYLRERAADALLAGSMTRLADRTWDIRYRLWDLVKGQPYFARAMTVVTGDLRLAAHRIADEIFEKLTSDKGVFATRIAYVTRAGANFSLVIADADGEGRQVAVASTAPIISPAWSPDGQSLAYVSFETGKAAVWVQELPTGKRSMVANFRGSNSAPAWSPNGRELAVTLSRDGIAQVYVLSLDGGPLRRLVTSTSIDTEPVFAPDGKSVFFVSDRGGGPQVYSVPVAGGRAERVTFKGAYNISPSVSPDGTTLAYVTRVGNTFRVTTQDLASGVVQTLTDSADDESPSFSPNGRLIVYASRAQGRDVLMTTSLDGRIKARLLATGLDMREPAWGPYAR